MNIKIVIVCFLFVLLFCVSVVHASDINETNLNLISTDLNKDYETLDNLESDLSENQLTDGSKNKTELSSQSTDIYYKGSYNVVLKDSSSNRTLGNKTINFVINNVNYNVNTDSKGVASIKLNLNPGKYNIFACFSGNDDYEDCNLTSLVNVLSTIKAADMSKYYKGNTQFSARFFDSNGNALTNKWVSFNLNGKTYSRQTNNNGYAFLPVNLNPGTYRIITTDPITGYKLTNNFNILPTVVSGNVNLVNGQNKKFSAKFFKSNGKPLAKTYVKYKFKGKIHKVKTNSKGMFSIPLKKLKKGTYKIVCYNKDGLSKAYTIKVYKRKASTHLISSSHVFYPRNKKIISVKLSTALGDSSNAGKIIKIKINGKVYSKKTDSQGVAYLDLSSIKKGIFNVEYNYGGDKFFKKSSSKNPVTIFDTTQTRISVKSTTHFGYGAGTLLKVCYNAGGVPLAKKTVTLKLAGHTYTRTTDNNGIISMPINLNIGNYLLNYSSKDFSVFKGTSGSFDINVFKRTHSKVVWKCGSSYKDNAQRFKVLVTDMKGKPASGGTAELTVDGESYTANVGSNGYASFKTDIAIGKYKVSVKFNGNNEHVSSSTSHSINVKLSKFGNGINEKNAQALAAYLKSSSHCKVGDAKIKALVKSLTSGLTDKVDKAKAIFNYVRDNLDYSYYFNSKYGATKTLKLKRGNCVDHSHLLVAMYRTAGFNARYVHGTCHFIKSGDTCGHVWAQVKIGNKWVCADAISYKNSLGKIRNWDTKHYSIHAKYASVPF